MSEPRPLAANPQDPSAPVARPDPLGATRWAFFAMLVLWAMSCALWTAATLPWTKGPDEADHFEYAYFLLNTRGLPDPTVDPILESHHPPLAHAGYAALLGLLIHIDEGLDDEDLNGRRWQRMLGRETTFEPGKSLAAHLGIDLEAVRAAEREGGIQGDERLRLAVDVLELRSWAFYVLRLPAVILCGWTLLLLLGCMRYLFPRAPGYALIMTGAIGSMPAYSFYFATVSNDPLVTWLSVLAAWLTLRARHRGELLEPRALAWISLVLGLAFLTKLHAIGAAAFCALCVFNEVPRGQKLQAIKAIAILALGPLLIAAWWHIRQTMLQGSPIATQNHADFRPEFLRLGERHPSLALDFFSSMISSFFGRFGNDTLVLPPLYYFPLEGLTGLALIGLVLFRRRSERWTFTGDGQHALPRVAAVVGTLLVVLNLLKLDFTYNAHSGRYLMPLIVPLAIGLAAGLARTTGRRTAAVLFALIGWNLLFGLVFYGIIFRNAYSIESDKVARGQVIAYYDAGNELFDQGSAGGNMLAQRFGMWTLPGHTMRLATQAPGNPSLVYRTPLPEDSTAPLQVRVRYPSMKGVADTDIPDPYGLVLIGNGTPLHGPMSIWGEFGELRYPVPRTATDGKSRLDTWWENLVRQNPIVAVTELWVEEAWLQVESARFQDQDRRQLEVTVRNLDHNQAHVAALFLQRADKSVLLGSLRDQEVAPRKSVTLTLSLPDSAPPASELSLRLVDQDLAPWSHTKLINWLKISPNRAGRLEVPDVAVLRHENRSGSESLLAEAQFDSPPAGDFWLEISHLATQDPLRRGQLRLTIEGGSRRGELEMRPDRYSPGLARTGFVVRIAPDAKALRVQLHSTPEAPGVAYDLDRLWLTPRVGPEAPGHEYPVAPSR